MVECFTGGKNKETDFVFTVCGTVGLYRIRYDGTGSELIPVLGGLLPSTLPADDRSYQSGGRLPLLSATRSEYHSLLAGSK